MSRMFPCHCLHEFEDIIRVHTPVHVIAHGPYGDMIHQTKRFRIQGVDLHV